MKHNKKGNAKTFIKVIFVIVIIAILTFLFLKGFGKGTGSGSSSNNQSAVEANADISSSSDEKDKLDYINITISGNDYIYENNKISCGEFIDAIKNKSNNNMTVKITNDNASQKAYSTLTDALENNNIKYIE